MAGDASLIGRFRELVDSCSRLVAFTAAGHSTESGIPDFRTPGTGLWTKIQPIDFSDFVSSEEKRRESWRRVNLDGPMWKAEPNRGHRAVAELVRRGVCPNVITQNVDGLHQKSGVPDNKVIELHGNATYAKCLDCGRRYELEPIVENFQRDETLPVCDPCGGIIKTATISFGQSMPEEAMRHSEEETLACDLFLVVGCSLSVFPAAGFPALAKRNGARLVILNRTPTDLDPIADLVLHMESGPTLGEVVGVD